MHVRQQLQWPNGTPTLVLVNSRKGVRSIPLPSITVRALRGRQAAQQAERRLIGEEGWEASDLVFNSEEGAPLHRNTITNQFHARVRAAGLEHLRPHDLRHTYGSLLMSQGVPLKTISELLATRRSRSQPTFTCTRSTFRCGIRLRVSRRRSRCQRCLAEHARPAARLCQPRFCRVRSAGCCTYCCTSATCGQQRSRF